MNYFSEPNLNQINTFLNVNLERKGERKVFWLERLHSTDLKILLWCAVLDCTKSPQSCPALCDLIDCSPPGSSVHGILQARILEWIRELPFPSPEDLPDPGITPRSPALQADSLQFELQGSPYHCTNYTHYVYPFRLIRLLFRNNGKERMGKTRDLFKKTRDTKGTFHPKTGSIKDRNGMDLTETEDIKKRWQEYTELYKRS